MIQTLLLATGLLTACASHPEGEAPRRWGEKGHEMAARVAMETLPAYVPAFFRAAGEQLVYLNPEPDRWRERSLVEMDQAYTYDHYIDWENVPAGAIAAPDRFSFLRRLYEQGVERPEQRVGFLPYRILELYERLVTEWRLWRAAAPGSERRRYVEQRIVNDAGILGHYVTDAANPHHTTIHFNGWDGETANPEGYTEDRGFHGRFEADFVRAHVEVQHVRSRMVGGAAPVDGGARAAVLGHIREAHARVDEMYRLERDVGFDPDAPVAPEALDFAAGRIAAGAGMLRDLWWSAWLESAGAP